MKMERSGGILHSQTHPDSHSPSHSVRIHRPRDEAADSFFAVAKRVVRAPGLPGLPGREFCMAAEKGPVRYRAPIHVDICGLGFSEGYGLFSFPWINPPARYPFGESLIELCQILSYKALFPITSPF